MLHTVVPTLLALASLASAHTFTLHNNCNYNVPLYVDSWPGSVAYTGPQPTLSPGQWQSITIPTGWDSRICQNADGGKCWGEDSMTEFTMDSEGLAYYDISNIEAFFIAQQIAPADSSCQTVTCTSANCPCSQAYPVGDESGCRDDAPVKACFGQDFTITYCP
ncbi:hypothetical protein DACRYDRAFT_98063 [Dacryopinax primogenitus]|uniref:Osmotin thaumatin-like protein n=1 Tax=Dacryopinax primogenitus (strain DJM 731) TaxID=1858805 RepID=M5GEA1_DACPD|nr:uncharacterized protein DACRYDRAFT_98063 [Dacryopinax primogenitus]EJU05207.1 hypothetical protein DACRYDRAFT_98063 [Dacryopinax primogenitus]